MNHLTRRKFLVTLAGASAASLGEPLWRQLEYKLSREQMSAGFLGEEILVNLTVRPYFDAARRIYRFRILNGSNARSYRLAFSQGSRLLDYYLIGTDGGLLEQPQKVRETFIGAAQRLDILLDLRAASGNESVFLKSLAFDPMHNESVDEKSGEPAAGAMQGSGMMQGMGGALPGMTMSFPVKDKAMLASLQPLQKVDFELTYDGKNYLVTNIK